MSLARAGALDTYNRQQEQLHKKTPIDTFSVSAYWQPSLTESEMKPEPYRLETVETDGCNTMTSTNLEDSNAVYNCLISSETVEEDISHTTESSPSPMKSSNVTKDTTSTEDQQWSSGSDQFAFKSATRRNSAHQDLTEEEREVILEELSMNEMLGGFAPTQALEMSNV